MATKRQAPDDGQTQGRKSDQRAQKRQRPDTWTKPPKKAYPVNELKSKIRSLQRLLQRNDNLPANLRVEKERALQSAQYDLDVAHRAKRRTDMIERYHKVRFFDRQKATRRLKKARKELRNYDGEDTRLREELGRKVDDAEVDVNYAISCPLDQPYVSLFPTRKWAKDDVGAGVPVEIPASEREGDVEMWERVKQCMADGTLTALREGKLESHTREGPEDDRKDMAAERERQSKEQRKNEKSARRSKLKDDEEEDAGNSDGSGGGFFE